jgi:hypothetical protein
LYTSGKTDTKYLQLILWLILNIPLGTAAQQKDFLHACAGFFKMAWHGDVYFKQMAVFEFLLSEKGLVTNIQKRLKCVRLSAVDKSTVSVELYEFQVLRKTKWSTVMRVAVTNQQQSLRRCFNILIKLFETTDGFQ